jgi:hypothetical protein
MPATKPRSQCRPKVGNRLLAAVTQAAGASPPGVPPAGGQGPAHQVQHTEDGEDGPDHRSRDARWLAGFEDRWSCRGRGWPARGRRRASGQEPSGGGREAGRAQQRGRRHYRAGWDGGGGCGRRGWRAGRGLGCGGWRSRGWPDGGGCCSHGGLGGGGANGRGRRGGGRVADRGQCSGRGRSGGCGWSAGGFRLWAWGGGRGRLAGWLSGGCGGGGLGWGSSVAEATRAARMAVASPKTKTSSLQGRRGVARWRGGGVGMVHRPGSAGSSGSCVCPCKPSPYRAHTVRLRTADRMVHSCRLVDVHHAGDPRDLAWRPACCRCWWG